MVKLKKANWCNQTFAKPHRRDVRTGCTKNVLHRSASSRASAGTYWQRRGNAGGPSDLPEVGGVAPANTKITMNTVHAASHNNG